MKLLQTALKVPYFEKYCPLNKKETAEGLIQSTYMYSLSSYMYSVWPYVFSLILFIFSQLTCIQSHFTCIQSDHIYSVWSYLYLVNLYAISLILYVFNLILYIFNHLLNMCSVTFYMHSGHICFVNIFNVLCITLKILLNLFFFGKKKEMNACHAITSYKEIKQTEILSIRKILVLVVMP